MTDYLTAMAAEIRDQVDPSLRPDAGDDLPLFRTYAVLAFAKGLAVTHDDVHNAWVGWMAALEPQHPALLPFEALGDDERRQDEPFLEAIYLVSKEHGLPRLEAPAQSETANDGAGQRE